MTFLRLFFVVFFALSVSQLKAQFINAELDSLPENARYAGMGNAVVSSADDDTSFLFNPALSTFLIDGDTKERRGDDALTYFITFNSLTLNLNLGISIEDLGIGDTAPCEAGQPASSYFNFFSCLLGSEAGADFPEYIRTNAQFIDSFFRQRLGLGIQPFNFGYVGEIGQTGLSLGFRAMSWAEAYVRIRQEGFTYTGSLVALATVNLMANVAYKFSIPTDAFDIPIAFGVNVKMIRRTGIDWQNIYLPSEPYALDGFFERNPAVAGTGFGVDLGFVIKPFTDEHGGQLSVGIAARDIGGTNINYSRLDASSGIDSILSGLVDVFGPGEPGMERAIRPSMDLGVSYYMPTLFGAVERKWISDIVLSMDIRDILTTSFTSVAGFFTRLHIGLEVKFFDGLIRKWAFLPLSLRVGLNQGYLTAGIGTVFLQVVHLDIAVWTKELGFQAGQIPNPGISFELKFML